MGTIILQDSVEPTIDREANVKPGFKPQVEMPPSAATRASLFGSATSKI
jgi:hypothetical protein